MKNLKGLQIGKYNCLQKLQQNDKMAVYKGCHSKDFSLVRMNVYNRQKLGQYIEVLREEVNLFQKCRSTHILNFLEKIETKNLYIVVTDFYETTLEDEIKSSQGLEEVDAIRIIKHVIKGLSKLHESNVIHRYLQAKYVSKVGEVYVINNLKYCKQMIEKESPQEIVEYSDPAVIAPEIIQGKASGYQVDVWSLGVLLYRMITYEYPEVEKQFHIDQNQNRFSKLAINFLKATIRKDKKQRITWKQLLIHGIFISKSTLFFNYAADLDFDEEIQMYKNKNLLKQSEYPIQSQIYMVRADTVLVQMDVIPESKLKQSIKYILKEAERNEKVKAYAEQLRFHYLKSMFFFEEIYKSFSSLKSTINVAERLKIEFQYFILSRSLYILSPVYQILKNGKNSFSWEFYEAFTGHSFCLAFLEEFQNHYGKIKKLLKQVSEQLSSHESKIKTRVFDFFWKTTNNNQYKQYERFLIGIQKTDFTVEQFFEFLKKQYVNNIIEAAKTSKNKQIIRLIAALDDIQRVIFLKEHQRIILDSVLKKLPKV